MIKKIILIPIIILLGLLLAWFFLGLAMWSVETDWFDPMGVWGKSASVVLFLTSILGVGISFIAPFVLSVFIIGDT